jgi:hypothetical protein
MYKFPWKVKNNNIQCLFFLYNFVSSKVCQGLILWFLGVYRVQELTKEEFVTNAIQVEMQCRHLHTARHAIVAY